MDLLDEERSEGLGLVFFFGGVRRSVQDPIDHLRIEVGEQNRREVRERSTILMTEQNMRDLMNDDVISMQWRSARHIEDMVCRCGLDQESARQGGGGSVDMDLLQVDVPPPPGPKTGDEFIYVKGEGNNSLSPEAEDQIAAPTRGGS